MVKLYSTLLSSINRKAHCGVAHLLAQYAFMSTQIDARWLGDNPHVAMPALNADTQVSL